MKLTQEDIENFLRCMVERGHTPGPWRYDGNWKVISQCKDCDLEGHLVEALHPPGCLMVQGPAILNFCKTKPRPTDLFTQFEIDTLVLHLQYQKHDPGTPYVDGNTVRMICKKCCRAFFLTRVPNSKGSFSCHSEEGPIDEGCSGEKANG